MVVKMVVKGGGGASVDGCVLCGSDESPVESHIPENVDHRAAEQLCRFDCVAECLQQVLVTLYDLA